MKCKPYSEITVEIRTQLKTVKITSNIFAVYSNQYVGSKYIRVNYIKTNDNFSLTASAPFFIKQRFPMIIYGCLGQFFSFGLKNL